MVCPHEHGHVLARYHEAGEAEIRLAIDAALEAKAAWENTPWEERAAIFNRMASLISTRYRYILNAATMLGQSKTAHQAEIDATCETADFFRYNAKFMEQIYRSQPLSNVHTWNRVHYRALEGFVLAVSPFNFTAIAANLATAPAIMGNTVVWKPASASILSNYYLMQLYKEAGLPAGVINFVPSRGALIGKLVLDHPSFAGLHFTGSTAVFNEMWQTVGGQFAQVPHLPAPGRARPGARTTSSCTTPRTWWTRRWPSCGRPSNTRGRSAPPAPGSNAPASHWPKLKASGPGPGGADQGGGPPGLPQLHGRGHRPRPATTTPCATWSWRGAPGRPRSWPAAGATPPRAGSWSRR